MKRLSVLLLLLLLLTGCEKQPTQTQTDEPETLSLPGKAYAAIFSNYNGSDLYWVARFKDGGKVEWSARSGSAYGTFINDVDVYPYTLKYPDITITRPSDGAVFRGAFVNFSLFRLTIRDYFGDYNTYEFVLLNE